MPRKFNLLPLENGSDAALWKKRKGNFFGWKKGKNNPFPSSYWTEDVPNPPLFSSWWLNHPFEKYARQIGSFSQVGVKIKNI